MTVINPWIFYLIDLLGALKFFAIGAVMFFTVLIFFYIVEHNGKLPKSVIIIFCVLVTLTITIPSKKTMYTMLVAENVTYENIDKASEVIQDSVDYIFDKFK